MRTKLVVLQPTSLCNLNCRYCYVPNRRDASRMSNQVLEAVFSKFLASPLVSDKLEFLWHAGEPLTVGLQYFKSATELCERYNTKGVGIQHTVQTNGLLVNDAWCDFFLDNNYCVGVSIDGPQAIHDFSRKTWGGKGSFESALRGFERLAKKGVDAGVLCVLSANSLSEPDAIYSFFRSIGAKWLAFNIEEVEGTNLFASTKSVDFPVIEQRYKEFVAHFFRRWNSDGRPFRIREVDDFLSILQPVMNGEDFFRRPDETQPFTIVTVQKNGDVSTFSPEFAGAATVEYSNFIIGNIITDSLDDITKSRNLEKINNEVQAGVSNCAKTCKWFTFCGGGYVSNKYYENGRISSTDTTACRLHRIALSSALMDELALLSKKEPPNIMLHPDAPLAARR